jgi:hypothetical protein
MSNITLSDDIKSEISIALDGKCSLSIRATALMLGIDDSALVRSFQTVLTLSPSKLVQNLTEKGFEPADFSDFGIPDLALPVVAFYYATQAGKRCTEQAKAVLQVLAGIGARTWLQQSKSFVVSENLKALPLPPISTRNQISKLVNDYAFATGLQYERVWRKIYAALNDHHNYDVGKKKPKGSKLDQIEADGQLENLLAVAHHYLQLTAPVLI